MCVFVCVCVLTRYFINFIATREHIQIAFIFCCNICFYDCFLRSTSRMPSLLPLTTANSCLLWSPTPPLPDRFDSPHSTPLPPAPPATCVCVCVYVCMCVCGCVCIVIYVCTYRCMYVSLPRAHVSTASSFMKWLLYLLGSVWRHHTPQGQHTSSSNGPPMYFCPTIKLIYI
jgi:hypothetical protein